MPMPKSETELEARLVTQAQTVIRKLLAQKAGRHDLSMSEMEGLVGDLEKDIGQAMMQELVEDSPVTSSGLCPKCQGKLRGMCQGLWNNFVKKIKQDSPVAWAD